MPLGQFDQERRPARAGPLDADAAAVGGEEFARDRESDAAAPPAAGPPIDGPRRVRAVEAFEDVRDVARRDARALVGDPDRDDGAPGVPRALRAVTATDAPPSGLWVIALPMTLRSTRDRCPGSTVTIVPAGTFDASSKPRSRRSPSSSRSTSWTAAPRSTAAGWAWSGAASALARSLSSATTLPSADAAERAASRFSPVGRHDAVDHRLELRDEDRGRRREVVGDIARRPPPEHLGALEAVGHRVERIGEIGRLAVVAAGRTGRGLAGPESPGRIGDVAQRPRQPRRDVRRGERDAQHAQHAAHEQRDVEERQEPAVADLGRQVGLERSR